MRRRTPTIPAPGARPSATLPVRAAVVANTSTVTERWSDFAALPGENRVLTVHESSHGKPVWVDLWNPTEEERLKACHEYGLEIPPRAEMEEIEFSSRLQYEDGVFTISVPVTPYKTHGEEVTSPLGFVL